MATIYNCANRPSQEVYEEIKTSYEEAYKCIDKALKLDEEGKTSEAIEMYEFGLNLIDVALGRPLESPSQPDVVWERTYAMIQKMRKSRKEILSRISDAQVRPSPEANIPPPSYEEAMASSVPLPSAASPQLAGPSTSAATPLPPYIPASAAYDANIHNSATPSYSDLNVELEQMKVAGNREIIYSHNNVRLYFIAPDGRVSATSEPDTLIIGRIEDLSIEEVLDATLLDIVDELSSGGEKKKHHGRHHRGHRHRRHHHHRSGHRSDATRELHEGAGQIYLQVGSWVYPLIPGVSPCYRADFGAFILPDIHSELEGAAVGLILPPNADKSVYDLLSQILLQVVGKDDLEPAPKAPTRSRRSDKKTVTPSARFSLNVVKGASYLANNLVRGAEGASRFIDGATPRLMSKMAPAQDPQPINPALKTTLGVAKTVTGKAASVTDYLAGKVGLAASSLGQYLAPHIQRQGSKLLSTTTSMSSKEAEEKMGTFLDATAGAVQGIATVYTGLESAAGILGRSLSNNTIQVIQYKYGQNAGEASGDAFSTAGNLYTVHSNTKIFKTKGMAKTVAKSAVKGAGIGIIEQYNSNVAHPEFQGSGPGAGEGFRGSMDVAHSASAPPFLQPPVQGSGPGASEGFRDSTDAVHSASAPPFLQPPVPARRTLPTGPISSAVLNFDPNHPNESLGLTSSATSIEKKQ